MAFQLNSAYKLSGDQEQAVDRLTEAIVRGDERVTLLGVTGSGKTFTMANVIARLDRPALVMSPNKTLAAQLYSEFKAFFPENAVEYFVSYYDYYQPEAYIPQTDTFIDKDAMINDRIDRLRLSATTSLLSRRDVIVIASISCIYGLGAPSEYLKMSLSLAKGQNIARKMVLRKLIEMQYSRGEDLARGTLRLRGDTLDIHSSYREDAYRVLFFGDEVEALYEISPLTGAIIREYESLTIFPAKHFVQSEESIRAGLARIEDELRDRYKSLKESGKILEAERILQRTTFDLEMIRELGFCSGIENYSRHLTGRAEGEAPYTLLDYFPPDHLTFLDESHVGIGQIHGMYNGDRSRKQVLVDFGFRLPSALDNRPLKGAEFFGRVRPLIFVSATPGAYEREHSKTVVEQLLRPTGLIDPVIEIRPAKGQVENLGQELIAVAERNERSLVTTLTKRTAEELTAYLEERGHSVAYLHSEIKTMERIEKLRALRSGEIDVLIGINLLREGLDLPEVSLVAILDADREGFLRSETSLIQTMGRAARHKTGRVILYADTVTGSMERAIEETNRRRNHQLEYNAKMGITPETIVKPFESLNIFELDPFEKDLFDSADARTLPKEAKALLIQALTKDMEAAAEALEFEHAAYLRDKIAGLK